MYMRRREFRVFFGSRPMTGVKVIGLKAKLEKYVGGEGGEGGNGASKLINFWR